MNTAAKSKMEATYQTTPGSDSYADSENEEEKEAPCISNYISYFQDLSEFLQFDPCFQEHMSSQHAARTLSALNTVPRATLEKMVVFLFSTESGQMENLERDQTC